MQLKRRLMVWVLAATGLTVGATATAWADGPEVGADIGIYSQYVWRGATQTGNNPAVQGDVSVSMDGVSLSAWFSNAYGVSTVNGANGQAEEFDWTVDYSGSAGAIGYSVGAIYYTYMYDGHSNFAEAYLGGSYDGPLAPSLTVYYTLTSVDSGTYESGDIWVDLGVSQSVDGYDLSGTLSFVNWASDASRTGANFGKDGLSVLALGVSKDVDLSGVTMTPSLTVTVPLVGKEGGQQNLYGATVDNEFIAGLNFAY